MESLLATMEAAKVTEELGCFTILDMKKNSLCCPKNVYAIKQMSMPIDTMRHTDIIALRDASALILRCMFCSMSFRLFSSRSFFVCLVLCCLLGVISCSHFLHFSIQVPNFVLYILFQFVLFCSFLRVFLCAFFPCLAWFVLVSALHFHLSVCLPFVLAFLHCAFFLCSFRLFLFVLLASFLRSFVRLFCLLLFPVFCSLLLFFLCSFRVVVNRGFVSPLSHFFFLVGVLVCCCSFCPCFVLSVVLVVLRCLLCLLLLSPSSLHSICHYYLRFVFCFRDFFLSFLSPPLLRLFRSSFLSSLLRAFSLYFRVFLPVFLSLALFFLVSRFAIGSRAVASYSVATLLQDVGQRSEEQRQQQQQQQPRQQQQPQQCLQQQ